MSNNNGRGRGRGRGSHHGQPTPVQQPLQLGIHSPQPAAPTPNNAIQQAPPPPVFGFHGVYPANIYHGDRSQMPPPLNYNAPMGQHMHPSVYGHNQHVGFHSLGNNPWAYPQSIPHQSQMLYSPYLPPATVQPHHTLRSQPEYGMFGPYGASPQPFNGRQPYHGSPSPGLPSNAPNQSRQAISRDRSPPPMATQTPMFGHGYLSQSTPGRIPSQQALGARRNHSALSLNLHRSTRAPSRVARPSPSETSFQVSASTPGNRSGMTTLY